MARTRPTWLRKIKDKVKEKFAKFEVSRIVKDGHRRLQAKAVRQVCSWSNYVFLRGSKIQSSSVSMAQSGFSKRIVHFEDLRGMWDNQVKACWQPNFQASLLWIYCRSRKFVRLNASCCDTSPTRIFLVECRVFTPGNVS